MLVLRTGITGILLIVLFPLAIIIYLCKLTDQLTVILSSYSFTQNQKAMQKIVRADITLQNVVPYHGKENCAVCCLVKDPEYSIQVNGDTRGYICSDYCATWMDEKQHIQERVLKGIENRIAAEEAIPPVDKKAEAVKKIQGKINAGKKQAPEKSTEKAAADNNTKDGTKGTGSRHRRK